ncbi:MAG TPA: amidohydrolase family protein, partial [Thauera aminoaromatica]|nr:amidohydrolase family protein [Thauera aminoaromatica]
MSEAVDLLINARWIVPVEPRDAVLADHAVAIRGGRIVDLLGQDEARTRYVADEVVELPRHLLIPGLVNLHTHAAMSLLRGIADDLPLMRWLEEAI